MNRYPILDAAAGVAAIAVALGVAELAARAVGGMSPVVAVGDFVIDHSPSSVTKVAIELFGSKDKPVLIVTIVAVTLVIGGVAGLLARVRFVAGVAVILALAMAGLLAGARAPLSSAETSTFIALSSFGAGVLALHVLTGASRDLHDAAVYGPVLGEDARSSRRKFLYLSGGALGLAAGSVLAGRRLFGPAVDIEAERAALSLPTPIPPAVEAPGPALVALDTEGISPLITPNSDFYRIDTALSVPRVEVEGWRLKVTGLVDRPFEVRYSELLDFGLHAETVTLCCVSNEVGGDLVGTATWWGVPLHALLERAGIQPEGTQIVARSVDGFTTAFPTAVALDGRASMVAVAMSGEVLPASHGFPARMIVPGLYGYVSATKWLEEIEVTTLRDFDAYWITRGWAKEGPIKTQSRTDVPKRGASITPGEVQVGGVAWAGNREVGGVEVRIIDETAARSELGEAWARDMGPGYGDWREARLSGELSSSSWRQWVIDWDAMPGTYRVQVRATDGLGDTQTHVEARPAPDGATGYHGFTVRVRH